MTDPSGLSATEPPGLEYGSPYESDCGAELLTIDRRPDSDTDR